MFEVLTYPINYPGQYLGKTVTAVAVAPSQLLVQYITGFCKRHILDVVAVAVLVGIIGSFFLLSIYFVNGGVVLNGRYRFSLGVQQRKCGILNLIERTLKSIDIVLAETNEKVAGCGRIRSTVYGVSIPIYANPARWLYPIAL
jgi:hypothetical protein